MRVGRGVGVRVGKGEEGGEYKKGGEGEDEGDELHCS